MKSALSATATPGACTGTSAWAGTNSLRRWAGAPIGRRPRRGNQLRGLPRKGPQEVLAHTSNQRPPASSRRSGASFDASSHSSASRSRTKTCNPSRKREPPEDGKKGPLWAPGVPVRATMSRNQASLPSLWLRCDRAHCASHLAHVPRQRLGLRRPVRRWASAQYCSKHTTERNPNRRGRQTLSGSDLRPRPASVGGRLRRASHLQRDRLTVGDCWVGGERDQAGLVDASSPSSSVASRSSFAGFRFPPDVITVAVRWYLRYGRSYRDFEELLDERGIDVDHVSVFRWVQRFTRLLIDAAAPADTPQTIDGSWTRPMSRSPGGVSIPGDRPVRLGHRRPHHREAESGGHPPVLHPGTRARPTTDRDQHRSGTCLPVGAR
jgi:hypothetical protein